MTIADHGEPSVAWMLVTVREGAVAASTTRVGVGRTTTGVMSHPCVQHGHGRALLSRRLRALISRLDRATLRGLVIDEDRGARVELVAYLCDFGRERHLVETIVGPFAGDERFNNAAQGVGTQHAVRNNHGRDASVLWIGPPSERSGRCRHGSSQWRGTRHALRGPQDFPPWHALRPASRAASVALPLPLATKAITSRHTVGLGAGSCHDDPAGSE